MSELSRDFVDFSLATPNSFFEIHFFSVFEPLCGVYPWGVWRVSFLVHWI